MINSVIIIGRIVRDIEMKYLQNGTAVSKFTVAVDRGLSRDKKQEAQSKGQPTADFLPVTVFGKSAENCANYLSKGSQVAVNGRVQTGNYTDKEGNKRYTTDIIANNVQFLDSKSSQSPKQETDGFSLADDIDDESIPF